MSEVSSVEHISKIFEHARRLLLARQTLVTTQREVEESERELERLNGSTSIDVGRFERLRFFECEGHATLRALEDSAQEHGQAPSLEANAACANVVQYESYRLDRDKARPDEPPACYGCAGKIEERRLELFALQLGRAWEEAT